MRVDRARVRRAASAILFAAGVAGCNGDYGNDTYYFAPYNVYTSVVIGDFDGDGTADVALAGSLVTGVAPDAGFVSFIRGNRSAPGTFLPGVHNAVGADPGTLVAADFNGDGHPDFAVDSDPLAILVQSASAPGTFTAGAALAAGLVYSIAAADLDRSGTVDLAAANCSNVLVYLQTGAMTFAALSPILTPAGMCATAIAIGDVNGDGLPDLVVTAASLSGGAGIVWVLPQDPTQPGNFLPGATYPVGVRPVGLRLADINADGRLDIIVLNEGSLNAAVASTVSVLLQDPTLAGSLLPAVNYTTGAHSEALTVGDLNGDGRPDIVVANAPSGPDANDAAVVVMLQDPANAGAFLAPASYAGVSFPVSVAIGDLNGDGLPDIAVADDPGAMVLFQVPGAPGTFQAATNIGK